MNAAGERLQAIFTDRNSQAPTPRRRFAEVYVFHTSKIADVEPTEFDPAFSPKNEEDDHHYDTRSRSGRAELVLVRPDQAIACVGRLDDAALDSFDTWIGAVRGR